MLRIDTRTVNSGGSGSHNIREISLKLLDQIIVGLLRITPGGWMSKSAEIGQQSEGRWKSVPVSEHDRPGQDEMVGLEVKKNR